MDNNQPDFAVPENSLENLAGVKGSLSISNSSGIFGDSFERFSVREYLPRRR
jgi:hypothetical protein